MPRRVRGCFLDSSMKVAVEVRADDAFGDFVVYVPPDSPVVAIEPYTCAPDAFNLAARGIAAGMRELAPGCTFEAGSKSGSASFELRVAALRQRGRTFAKIFG